MSALELAICIESSDNQGPKALYPDTSLKEVFRWLSTYPGLTKHVRDLYLDCWLDDDGRRKNPGVSSATNIMKILTHFYTLHYLSLTGRNIFLKPLNTLPTSLRVLSLFNFSVSTDELLCFVASVVPLKTLVLKYVEGVGQLQASDLETGLKDLSVEGITGHLLRELVMHSRQVSVLRLPLIARYRETLELTICCPPKTILCMHVSFNNRNGDLNDGVFVDLAELFDPSACCHLVELHLEALLMWVLNPEEEEKAFALMLTAASNFERLFIGEPISRGRRLNILEILEDVLSDTNNLQKLKVLHFDYEENEESVALFEENPWSMGLIEAVMERELETFTGTKWSEGLIRSMGGWNSACESMEEDEDCNDEQDGEEER